MRLEEWPEILALVQSTLNKKPSRHRANFSPITVFFVADSTTPIRNFLRKSTVTPMTVSETKTFRFLNVEKINSCIADLHPLVSDTLEASRHKSRGGSSSGELPNFHDGYFVLVARGDFYSNEKVACGGSDHVV